MLYIIVLNIPLIFSIFNFISDLLLQLRRYRIGGIEYGRIRILGSTTLPTTNENSVKTDKKFQFNKCNT